MRKDDITVVICCAGMGTRLGIGTTKALLNVNGKPIIIHQLELLKNFKDVRIVVGYQANRVIEVVKAYREDVMFVFNYDFEHNGPGASLTKAMMKARKYIVVMDGDCIINVDDFNELVDSMEPCIGITEKNSDEAIYVDLKEGLVEGFTQKVEDFEWNGVALIEAEKLEENSGYVFEMIGPLLPIKAVKMRSRDVDTQDDYDRMITWVTEGCLD